MNYENELEKALEIDQKKLDIFQKSDKQLRCDIYNDLMDSIRNRYAGDLEESLNDFCYRLTNTIMAYVRNVL